MNFELFKDVLEYVPTQKNKIKGHSINVSSLSNSVLHFCKNIDYLISLSGGVDSMVLMTILHYFNINVVAVHINYNNRLDSVKEQDFLEVWCHHNNIKLHVKSIDTVKRNENYEHKTRFLQRHNEDVQYQICFTRTS